MMTALIVVSLVALVCAGLAGWLVYDRAQLVRQAAGADQLDQQLAESTARIEHVSGELDRLQRELGELTVQRATLNERLENQKAAHAQHLAQLSESAEQRAHETDRRIREINETYQHKLEAIASQALSKSSGDFLRLAKEHFEKHRKDAQVELDQRTEKVQQLVAPITETLRKTDEKLALLERARLEAFARLDEQLGALREGSASLKDETARLVGALKKPEVRGRYGEMQLQRIAEIAGMRPYCDFSTQDSTTGADGSPLRPDMVVSLPGGRTIVIDAKTNLGPYVDAFESSDPDEQSRHLDRFAKGVLEQAKKLAGKGYWSRYDGSPDFVVMFVPGDQFVDAALARQGDLLEVAAQHKVILASPSTLIGLLRAVHVGWREKDLTDQAEELFALGRELHDRSSTLLDHMSKLGTHLGRAVGSFNDMVGSNERRLLPTLRKFEEAGAKSAKQLAEPKPIEAAPAIGRET